MREEGTSLAGRSPPISSAFDGNHQTLSCRLYTNESDYIDDIQGGSNHRNSLKAVPPKAHTIGIALLPEFFVINDIRDGRLISFLESNVHFSGGIFAVYPQHRHLLPSLRTFIDYLVGHIDQLELLYGNR
ncbi:MAG: hypothetical protein KZQ93_19855 [Candidatus Thiodiazotropha sp. (ex Monitilora ramsayi)]|nr:hypothetical protein [Candidatus Thiodiazotropha sp. (ex Monitilora ramsayi)]